LEVTVTSGSKVNEKMANEPKPYRVTQEYNTPYPDSIFFHEGEIVEVGEEYADDPQWENWVWCKGQNNNQAWTPKQFLKLENGKGIFIRDYDARELSVKVGEELLVGEVINGFGMAQRENGERGWVPMRCFE
jgi:hypothetical protein